MTDPNEISLDGLTILITGGARRLGKHLVEGFHAAANVKIAIHYNTSKDLAQKLADKLNAVRADSAIIVQANLLKKTDIDRMVKTVLEKFKGLDLLVNNASTFYKTPLGTITEEQFEDLIGTNYKAPLFVSQACLPALRESKYGGNIINLVDINAQAPLNQFSVYCGAKSALAMLTKAIALEEAPAVRCNSISPGLILWAVGTTPSEEEKKAMQKPIPLGRKGDGSDIVHTALFLAKSKYITGQDIPVCGGLSLKRGGI